jgi:hypothetical protein
MGRLREGDLGSRGGRVEGKGRPPPTLIRRKWKGAGWRQQLEEKMKWMG